MQNCLRNAKVGSAKISNFGLGIQNRSWFWNWKSIFKIEASYSSRISFRDIKIRIQRPRFGQNLVPWIFLQPKSWFCIRYQHFNPMQAQQHQYQHHHQQHMMMQNGQQMHMNMNNQFYQQPMQGQQMQMSPQGYQQVGYGSYQQQGAYQQQPVTPQGYGSYQQPQFNMQRQSSQRYAPY